MISIYRYPSDYNVGDMLSIPVLKHYLSSYNLVEVPEKTNGKLMAIGSIMSKLKPTDVVWSTGVMRATDKFPIARSCKFLAVRGKLSREILVRDGGVVPHVYGDGGLLLPRIYNPLVMTQHKVGIIPHYVDKVIGKAAMPDAHFIDVAWPWEVVVDNILSCERIVSSSLHGLIISEAYGIPVTWVEWSDKVIGKGFKFMDYLTGTDREPQRPGPFPPIRNLDTIQNKLEQALLEHYDK